MVTNIHHIWQLISKYSLVYDYIVPNIYCYKQVIKQRCDM